MKQMLYHTINKNHFVKSRWAVCGCMRVCDTSLEPYCHKNDHVINLFWFARAARPQCAKMCFLLYKAVLNGRFQVCIANMNCRYSRKNAFPKLVICYICALRPQCAKMCFLLHKKALNGRFEAYMANMNCRYLRKWIFPKYKFAEQTRAKRGFLRVTTKK